MSNKQTTRTGNTVFELMSMACMEEVAASQAVKDELTKLLKHTNQVQEKLGFEAATEIENNATELYHLYAEQMFKWGWKLRGNPDLLAELIEPE